MKYLIVGVITIALVIAIFKLGIVNVKAKGEVLKKVDEVDVRLKEKAAEALAFCKEKDFDTSFCILIDMKVHSGKNRMFLWSFTSDKTDMSALCAHGIGKGEFKSSSDLPTFSNVNGSNCTSLGKYRLGIRSYSNWGINVHYKMHGLEDTNNKSFERIVVLHSFTPVPKFEIYPAHLPLGWSLGCPVTDNDMMTYLDKKLQQTSKSVLLWIYY